MSNDLFNSLYDKHISDEKYRNIANEPKFEKNREFMLKLWNTFHPFCEDIHEFMVQLRIHFYQRSWELYLGYNLIKNSNGKLFKKSNSSGPDFVLEHGGKTIYIEAICPMTSEEATIKFNNNAKIRKAINTPVNERIVIMSGAIRNKILTYKRYLDNDILKENDPYIIALNTGEVQFTNHEELISYLYDIGDEYIEIDRESGEVTGSGNKRKGTISTTKDGIAKEVEAGLFIREENKNISGVIFSSQNIINIQGSIGYDIIFIPNVYAANPVKKNIFQVGSEYIKNEGQLELIKH